MRISDWSSDVCSSDLEAYLSTVHQQPIGRLRIDLPTTFGRRHILPSLLKLGLRYPRLDLSVSLRDRPVDLVSEGIDLAVRIGGLLVSPDITIGKESCRQRG